MDKLNIAIADDNAKVLQLLDKIVSSDEELNVVGKAGNGEDLYDIIKKQEPDVVLLDLVMPKVDGLTVMERVNKDQEIRKHPAFIVITAVGQEKITEDAFDLGADYYILKPFDNEMVINRIKHTRVKKDRNFAKVQKVNAYESKKEYMERNLETDVTNNCDRGCCCDLICFTVVCDRCCTFGCHRLECRIFLIICNVRIIFYRNHQIAVLFCDRIFRYADLACYMCVSGRITDTDDVIAVLHHVCCLVCIVRSHLCCIVCDRQYLRFTRCQFVCLCISCQFLIRFVQHKVWLCRIFHVIFLFLSGSEPVLFRPDHLKAHQTEKVWVCG